MGNGNASPITDRRPISDHQNTLESPRNLFRGLCGNRDGARRYSANRFTIIVSFCPPNPNEFDSATSTRALRATFGT